MFEQKGNQTSGRYITSSSYPKDAKDLQERMIENASKALNDGNESGFYFSLIGPTSNKLWLGHVIRVFGGFEHSRITGWKSLSDEERTKMEPIYVAQIIAEHWGGDLNASNIQGAKRILEMYLAAPDTSQESIIECWTAYKQKRDADFVNMLSASQPAITPEDLLKLVQNDPALAAKLGSLFPALNLPDPQPIKTPTSKKRK